MTAPSVELRFNPTDLRPRDLPKTGAFLGSPTEALEAALAVARAQMADRVRTEIKGIGEPNAAQLLRIADLAWQASYWNFRQVTAPVIAEAYVRAYRRANAGDVPMSIIYNLADKHVEKIGDYFHSSSRDALSEGFATMVNRQIPARVAADRALSAYGLAPRQMRGFLAAKQLQSPVDSPIPRAIKARARAYVDKAFRTRIRKMASQEEHNIDEQAKQFAWMWLQDKGRLSKKAQKVWITAKDERVCSVCGPLHGKRVGVNERFVTAQGEFWTPGLHPNCRCEVRLLENRFAKALAGAELDAFNRLHPRADDGRFGVKARTKTIDVDEEFKRIVAQPTRQATLKPLRHITYAPPEPTHADPELDRMFNEIVSAKTQGFVGTFDSPLQRRTFEQVTQAITDTVASPEELTKLEVEVRLRLEAKRRAAALTRPQTKTKPPLQQVGKDVYAVLDRTAFDPKNPNKLQLDQGVRFVSDPSTAAEEASEKIREEVLRSVDSIMKEGGRFRIGGKNGPQYQLNRNQVRDVVAYYAREVSSQGHATTPYPLETEMRYIPWVSAVPLDDQGQPVLDSAGQPQTDIFSPAFIGDHFDLDKEAFEIKVIKVSEGFQDKTHPIYTSISGEKPETWSFEGIFKVRPSTIEQVTGQRFNAQIMRVEPLRTESD